MNNSRQKKLILLYQLFAIFSLVFQTFAPLLATAAPVFAADASATASADLDTTYTFESSAQIKLEIEEADEAEVVEEVLDDESLVAGEAEAVLDDTKAEADAGEEVAEEKVVEEETVEQEDVAVNDASAPDYFVDEIAVGNTYVFNDSLGQQVQLTFTWIDNEVSERTLSINELILSPEEQEELGAVSEVAYDITSSMPNGSFKYDLGLLLESGLNADELEVEYAESPETLDETKDAGVEEKTGNMVTVKGLDHFTVFVVVNPLPDGVTEGEGCEVASINGACYDTIQEAVDAADPSDGIDTIEILSDHQVSAQININKELVVNGNGYTLASPFTKTTNSNNSAIGIYGDNVVINDLVINGAGSTDLHGITTYKAENLTLNDLQIKDFNRSGLVVNGSIVTVNNISTSGNGWHGINVDQGSGVTETTKLTLNGVSSHGDLIHILVDDVNEDVSVIDTGTQYLYATQGATRIYGLINNQGMQPVDGTVGLVEDSEASNGGSYLRHTGNPAPDNYSHSYQWEDPTISCTPNNVPVVLEGQIDASGMDSGDVAMIGLFDTDMLESGETGWQIGAYLYVHKNSANTLRIGPSDGNVGGEIVSKFVIHDISENKIVDIKVAFFAGSVFVSVDGASFIVDSYGAIKGANDAQEFENGATFGWDSWPASENLAYDFNIGGCDVAAPKDAVVPQMGDIKMYVNGVDSRLSKPGDTVRITAEVTDLGSDIDKVNIWVREFPWSPNHNELTSGLMTHVSGDLFEFVFEVPDTYKDGDPLNEMVDGNYFNFRPYDTAGNSQIGWRENFTIDGTSPSATITAPVLSNVDPEIIGNGNDGDGLGVARHWFEIKAPNGETYYWQDFSGNSDSVSFKLSDVSKSGGVKLPVIDGHLPNGSYRIRYVVSDKVGNRSDDPNYQNSVIHELMLDSKHAQVEIQSPVKDESISGTYLIQGIAVDPDPSSGIKNLILRIGTQADNINVYTRTISYDENTNSWQHEIDTIAAGIPDGYYNIRVRAQDNAGNNGVPGMHVLRDFIVDKTAPTSTITSPNPDTYFNSEVVIEGMTEDANGVQSVTLSYAEYDANEDVCGAYTELTQLENTAGGSPFNWSYNWTPETEGSYCLQAKGTDVAGNVEHTAEVKNVTFDITIPEVELTVAPVDPDGKRSWYHTQPEITLAPLTQDVERIEYQWNGTSGSWETYTSPIVIGQGNNELHYRAVDYAGNYSDTGVKVVRFDKEEPTEVENFLIHRDGKSARIVWDAASDNLGIYRYEVIWEHENSDQRYSEKVGSDVREYELEDLDDGQWNVRVRAEDQSGWTTTTGRKGLTIVDGEVAGVSNEESTGTGGAIQGFVAGISDVVGEVLGATDEIEEDSETIDTKVDVVNAEGLEGQVAGAETTCETWRYFLPALMLLLALVSFVLVELLFEASFAGKALMHLLLAGGAILVITLLADGNCYTEGSALSFAANWFWAITLGLGALVKMLGAAFTD